MRHRTAWIMVAVLALVVATAGCGARLNKAQTEAAIGAGGGSGGGSNNRAGAGTNTAATSTTNPATATTTAGGTAGTEGTAGSAGTSGETGGGGGATGVRGIACAKTAGHTAPGLDDNTIKIGNVSAISGLVQNFGATSRDGAKAFFEYVNTEFGGVCGRKLELVAVDDGLDPGKNRAQTERLANEVFAFAGSLTAEDDGGAPVRAANGIPDCSIAIGNDSKAVPTNFSPSPTPPGAQTAQLTPTFQYLQRTYGITKVGIVYQDNPNAKNNVDAFRNDILAAGLAVSGPYPVPVIGANYDTPAAAMKSDGADALITIMEINAIAGLARAVKKIDGGTWMKVPFYGAQMYGPDFLRLAGDASEGALIVAAHDIVESPSGPETTTFAEWYGSVSGGAAPDFFAIQGWMAAEICVMGIALAGGAPTREAVSAAITNAGFIDFGSLATPRNPGAHGNAVPECLIKVITVQGGAWAAVYPQGGGFGPC